MFRGCQWLRLSSFSYDYWRDSYPLIVLGPSDSNAFSALLKIPFFRLCDLRNRHLMLSLLVTVGIGWSSLISSHHVTMSVDECFRLATCLHCWWSHRHFLLLADGFSCRLFCDDILVTRVFWRLHCLLAMDICLYSFVTRFLRRRCLLLCIQKVWLRIILVVEVLTSHNGGAFFWTLRRPHLVSSQSTSFARVSSSSRRVSKIAR